MSEIHVRLAVSADCEQLSQLREALWPDSAAEEHAREITCMIAEKCNGTMPLAIFVAQAANEELTPDSPSKVTPCPVRIVTVDVRP